MIKVFTKSRSFSFSAFRSCFSSSNSSRNVGLSGFSVRAVPGDLRALFNGDFGVCGGRDAWLAGSLSATYPNPTSDTCGWRGSADGSWKGLFVFDVDILCVRLLEVLISSLIRLLPISS